MKRLVLIVLLASTVLVVYGQKAKSHRKADAANATTEDKDAPSTPGQTVIVVNQQAPQGQENSKSNQPPSYFHELLLPANLLTICLIGVGIVGIILAVMSLNRVDRQINEMRRQVDLTFGQLRAMNEQITEMSVQSDILRDSVKAAQDAAAAATKSADTFVLSERAWIEVHMAKPPDIQVSVTTSAQDGGTRHTIKRVWLWPDVMNLGKTPAKITKIIIVTCQIPKPLGMATQMPPELPPQPNYEADEQRRIIGIERDAMLAPNKGITPIPVEVKAQEWERIKARKSTLYLYGFVDYLDVISKPHQTRFCEVYWVPADPDDPNQPGFVTAGNTPAAYTECT